MDAIPPASRAAALIAEPARARMLGALLSGAPRTASELALCAGVTAQTASSHLSALREAGIVALRKRGRNRYYTLCGPAVAQAMEALEALAAQGAHPGYRAALATHPLRLARTCYDHLAGVLGVALTEKMVRRRYLEPRASEFRLKLAGERFFSRFGLRLDDLRAQRRQFARQCLDWSERRAHLAGSLGAALAARCFELGWLARVAGSRAVTVTNAGRAALLKRFALALPP